MAERREVAQPVRTRAGGALERPGRALVKLAPSRQQKVLVDDLVNERVREPVPASIVPLALSPDQIPLDERTERLLEGPRPGRDLAQQRLVEDRAEYRRFLEQAPGVGGQAVDAREHQPLEGRRYVERLGRVGTRPAITLTHERALAHQAPNDLLDEERIAARASGDEILKLIEPPAHRSFEEPRHQLARLVAGERSEPDHLMGGTCDQRGLRVGALREEHHQRPILELIDHLAEQIDRGGVRPVQVFHQDKQRFPLEPPLDQRARRQGDLALELLGLDLGTHLLLDAEHVAEHRRDDRRLLVAGSESPEPRNQLLSRDLQ